MSEVPDTHRRPSPRPRSWRGRLQLPMPTVVTLGVLAAALWLNAVVNHSRFNVAIAVLASLPLLVVVARSAVLARK